MEAISYRIPTFKLNGHDLIYFAGFKTHIGLYPVHADGPEFSPQVARYASGKATLKFPLDEPLPIELITQVVKAKLRHAKAPKTRGSQEPGHPPHAPTCTLALPNRSERVEDEGGHSLWLHPCSNPTH